MNLLSRILTLPLVLASSLFCTAGDDVDFARGLARDGFVQQAEEVCRKIEAGTDAEEKAAVPLVRAEIAARRAAGATTAAEARRALAEGAAALDAFVAAHPRHRRVEEARMQAGLLRRQFGEVAAQEAADGGREAAAPARDELRRAAKDFEAAAAAAKERRQALAAAGRPAADLEEADGQVAEAAYQSARCLHLRARLEEDAAERRTLLLAALDAFVNLEFDYGETGLVLEASLHWAQVLRDLGRPADALSRFDVAWKVTAPWRDAAARPPLPAWEREVAERAAAGKAATLTAMGRPAEALDAVEALLKLVPDAAGDRSGFLAVLEKGEALSALGRGREAAVLATGLLKSAPSAALKELAARRLRAWGGAGSPEALRLTADAEFSAGAWQNAWDGYRAVLAASEAPDPELLWRLATCADQLRRPWEAVVLFEAVAADHPRAAEAPRAAFRAAQIWNLVASREGEAGRWERAQVERLLRLLVTNWPDDPNAKNALYLVADASFERGEFEAAARDFARVPEDSNLRAQALLMCGRAHLKDAEARWAQESKRAEARAGFTAAETAFGKAVESALAHEPARTAVAAAARLSLAALYLHEQDSRPPEAIAALEKIPAAELPEQEKRAGELMVRARIANGEPAKAAEAAAVLARRFRGSAAAARASRDAAQACDAAAETGGDGAEALRAAAVAAYADSVEAAAAANQPAPDAPAIADRAFQLALALNGIPDDASLDDAPAALPRPAALRDAARVIRGAAAGPVPAGWSADFRLGRALGLAGDLAGARDAFGRVVEDEGVLRDGRFNAAAIAGRAWVLAAYEELGFAHLRLGVATPRGPDLDAAYRVFSHLAVECARETGPWWRAKVGLLRVLVERGRPGDFELAELGLNDLLSAWPDLDEGKFGVKPKVEALKERVKAKKGGGR